MLTLTINNSLSEMAALEPFTVQMGREFQLDQTLVFQLQLALDEAVSNIVNYAYGEATGMPVTITADVAAADDGFRELKLCLLDHGFAFNPLADAPEVDTTSDAEKRQIGGLGIFLIRQMMDKLEYERVGEQNVLTMIKKI